MTQPPSGEYELFETVITSGHGRLTYTIPDDKLLPVGIYPVKMVVRCVYTLPSPLMTRAMWIHLTHSEYLKYRCIVCRSLILDWSQFVRGRFYMNPCARSNPCWLSTLVRTSTRIIKNSNTSVLPCGASSLNVGMLNSF